MLLRGAEAGAGVSAESAARGLAQLREGGSAAHGVVAGQPCHESELLFPVAPTTWVLLLLSIAVSSAAAPSGCREACLPCCWGACSRRALGVLAADGREGGAAALAAAAQRGRAGGVAVLGCRGAHARLMYTLTGALDARTSPDCRSASGKISIWIGRTTEMRASEPSSVVSTPHAVQCSH